MIAIVKLRGKYVPVLGNILFENIFLPCFQNISLTEKPSNDDIRNWPHNAPRKVLSTFWLT